MCTLLLSPLWVYYGVECNDPGTLQQFYFMMPKILYYMLSGLWGFRTGASEPLCFLMMHIHNSTLISKCLRPSRNKMGRNFFLAAPKMVSFFTVGSWEKDTIFGAAQTNIWPFLFCQSFSTYHFSFNLEFLLFAPVSRLTSDQTMKMQNKV